MEDKEAEHQGADQSEPVQIEKTDETVVYLVEQTSSIEEDIDTNDDQGVILQTFSTVSALIDASILRLPEAHDFITHVLPVVCDVNVLWLKQQQAVLHGQWADVSAARVKLMEFVHKAENAEEIEKNANGVTAVNIVRVEKPNPMVSTTTGQAGKTQSPTTSGKIDAEMPSLPKLHSACITMADIDEYGMQVNHNIVEDNRIKPHEPETCEANVGTDDQEIDDDYGASDVQLHQSHNVYQLTTLDQNEIHVKDISVTINSENIVVSNNNIVNTALTGKRQLDHKYAVITAQPVCNICKKEFKDMAVFQRHLARAHIEKRLQCQQCDKVYGCTTDLRRHIRVIHNQELVCRCHICGKAFNEKRYLTVHLKRHAGEKRFQCAICSMKFFENHKLKWHMETHKNANDKVLPYCCKLCNRQFYNKVNMEEHMNTHTGKKPYRCTVCKASFAHRIGLKRHLLTHSDDKPFQCHICHKAFKLKTKLNNHMVYHTGQGSHKCENCGKVFTVANSLKRHSCSSRSCGTRSSVMYMCRLCQALFPTLQEAESHSHTHEPNTVEISSADIEVITMEDMSQSEDASADIIIIEQQEDGSYETVDGGNAMEINVATETVDGSDANMILEHETGDREETAIGTEVIETILDNSSLKQIVANTLADLSSSV